MEEEMRNLIIAFRLTIDTFINSVGLLNPSREMSLVHTNLQRAKMWLGNALGELGGKSPYKSSMDPNSKEIEPQAEHGPSSLVDSFLKIDQTQTAHVKAFRAIISEYQTGFDQALELSNTKYVSPWLHPYLVNSRYAMIEAKNWLGWELNRIKNEKAFQKAVEDGTVGAAPEREPMPL